MPSKVYATEIDTKKLEELRAEVAKRKLQNVVVVESKEADTNLPAACCDAIFLRRVYHHLTKPTEFDANLVRSLKPGGRLAIIDSPARPGLDPVEGAPSNRGGHGIPQKIVIEELTAAGLQMEKIVTDWPDNDYCVLFVKKLRNERPCARIANLDGAWLAPAGNHQLDADHLTKDNLYFDGRKVSLITTRVEATATHQDLPALLCRYRKPKS
jgi:SAM-dependent methyltransferase